MRIRRLLFVMTVKQAVSLLFITWLMDILLLGRRIRVHDDGCTSLPYGAVYVPESLCNMLRCDKLIEMSLDVFIRNCEFPGCAFIPGVVCYKPYRVLYSLVCTVCRTARHGYGKPLTVLLL